MKRRSTVLALCGLLIIADMIAAAQTIKEQTNLVFVALAAEVVLAGGLAWVAIEVLRKRYRRQKHPVSRSRFAIARL